MPAAIERKARRKPVKVGRKVRQPESGSQEIHDKLRRLVTKRRGKRTDADIARAAGITPARLSQVLSGLSGDPRVSTILAILDAIDATLCDLDRA